MSSQDLFVWCLAEANCQPLLHENKHAAPQQVVEGILRNMTPQQQGSTNSQAASNVLHQDSDVSVAQVQFSRVQASACLSAYLTVMQNRYTKAISVVYEACEGLHGKDKLQNGEGAQAASKKRLFMYDECKRLMSAIESLEQQTNRMLHAVPETTSQSFIHIGKECKPASSRKLRQLPVMDHLRQRLLSQLQQACQDEAAAYAEELTASFLSSSQEYQTCRQLINSSRMIEWDLQRVQSQMRHDMSVAVQYATLALCTCSEDEANLRRILDRLGKSANHETSRYRLQLMVVWYRARSMMQIMQYDPKTLSHCFTDVPSIQSFLDNCATQPADMLHLRQSIKQAAASLDLQLDPAVINQDWPWEQVDIVKALALQHVKGPQTAPVRTVDTEQELGLTGGGVIPEIITSLQAPASKGVAKTQSSKSSACLSRMSTSAGSVSSISGDSARSRSGPANTFSSLSSPWRSTHDDMHTTPKAGGYGYDGALDQGMPEFVAHGLTNLKRAIVTAQSPQKHGAEDKSPIKVRPRNNGTASSPAGSSVAGSHGGDVESMVMPCKSRSASGRPVHHRGDESSSSGAPPSKAGECQGGVWTRLNSMLNAGLYIPRSTIDPYLPGHMPVRSTPGPRSTPAAHARTMSRNKSYGVDGNDKFTAARRSHQASSTPLTKVNSVPVRSVAQTVLVAELDVSAQPTVDVNMQGSNRVHDGRRNGASNDVDRTATLQSFTLDAASFWSGVPSASSNTAVRTDDTVQYYVNPVADDSNDDAKTIKYTPGQDSDDADAGDDDGQHEIKNKGPKLNSHVQPVRDGAGHNNMPLVDGETAAGSTDIGNGRQNNMPEQARVQEDSTAIRVKDVHYNKRSSRTRVKSAKRVCPGPLTANKPDLGAFQNNIKAVAYPVVNSMTSAGEFSDDTDCYHVRRERNVLPERSSRQCSGVSFASTSLTSSDLSLDISGPQKSAHYKRNAVVGDKPVQSTNDAGVTTRNAAGIPDDLQYKMSVMWGSLTTAKPKDLILQHARIDREKAYLEQSRKLSGRPVRQRGFSGSAFSNFMRRMFSCASAQRD